MGSPRLTSIVREGIAHNPDLKIAAARVDQSRTLVTTAAAPFYPKLDFEMTGNKTQQNFVGFPIPGTNGVLKQASEYYNASLKAEWEIDVWGRYRAGTSAAIAGYQAAEQDERAAQASIAAQVSHVFERPHGEHPYAAHL